MRSAGNPEVLDSRKEIRGSFVEREHLTTFFIWLILQKSTEPVSLMSVNFQQQTELSTQRLGLLVKGMFFKSLKRKRRRRPLRSAAKFEAQVTKTHQWCEGLRNAQGDNRLKHPGR